MFAILRAILDSSKPSAKTPQIETIFFLGKVSRNKAKHKLESIPLLREIAIVSKFDASFFIEFTSRDFVLIPLGSDVFSRKFCQVACLKMGFSSGSYLMVKKLQIAFLFNMGFN